MTVRYLHVRASNKTLILLLLLPWTPRECNSLPLLYRAQPVTSAFNILKLTRALIIHHWLWHYSSNGLFPMLDNFWSLKQYILCDFSVACISVFGKFCHFKHKEPLYGLLILPSVYLIIVGKVMHSKKKECGKRGTNKMRICETVKVERIKCKREKCEYKVWMCV